MVPECSVMQPSPSIPQIGVPAIKICKQNLNLYYNIDDYIIYFIV